ncbi:protein BNIP5 [Thomomys bottae]
MENRRGPRKSLAARRAGSLDRSQAPRRDSEARTCQCLSLRTTPSQRVLRRVASDVAGCSQSPAPSTEAQGTEAAAPALDGNPQFIPREQGSPEDAKKDKSQRRAQQGWLKMVLNFFPLKTGPEEPKEKSTRKSKWKEEPTEPLEAAEDPALRKKAPDKKANRKKHRKHDTEETLEAPNQKARGQEAWVPVGAADPGLACRGAQESGGCQPLPAEGCSAEPLDISPCAAGPLPEEEPKKPDQDAVIWRIVEFLKEVGDQYDEQAQVPQQGLAPQNPAPALRKKPQDKKASVKKSFSLKKPGSEVPKRMGTADAVHPEARPPRRPTFLPLCIGGHHPSSSSSPDSEAPEVCEALSVAVESPSSSDLPCQGKHLGAGEEPSLDRASESREFVQKILALLQDAEELEGEQQPQVLEAELAVENLAPVSRKKTQEKKSSLRRVFSHKKHGSKEPKRGGEADTASPEARRPKKPSFLPVCVGGHRPSISSSTDAEGLQFPDTWATEARPPRVSEAPSQARRRMPDQGPQLEGTWDPKELLICKLVALLQEVDGELGKQIRRHPSFKSFFHEFSDTSLRKLVATLQSQQGRSAAGVSSLAVSSPFAFDLMNQLASHQSRSICSLMGSRGHCSGQSYAQFPARKASQNITNLESFPSPD